MKPLEKQIQELIQASQTPLALPSHTGHFTDEEFREIHEEIQHIYGCGEPGTYLRAVEDEHFKTETHEKLATYLLENQKLLLPAGLHQFPQVHIHPKAKYDSQGIVDMFPRKGTAIRGVQIAGWGIDDGYKVVYSNETHTEIIADIETKSIWELDEIRPIYRDDELPF